MTRRSPLRRRSKNPKAVSKLALGNRLSEWARAEGECAICGRRVGSFFLDGHHLRSRGADASLVVCPAAYIPLCQEYVGCRAHARAHGTWVEQRDFKAEVEARKPGIYDYLKLLGRTTWFKRDLAEVEAEIDRVTKRPWSEHWESLEVA